MSQAEQFPAPASPYPAIPPPVTVAMVTTAPRPCSYLPDRETTLRAFYAGRVSPRIYHDFMNAGFRRAGRIIYQPICRGCRACMPIRIPVAEFAPNKSLRRCQRQNADLVVDVKAPELSDEKVELYGRYLAARHNRGDESGVADNAQALEDFLYRSPVETIEFTYRDAAGRLLAVGICDICPRSLSSVYFFFDPDASHRGLGNFGALMEIQHARLLNIPFWYLGFWVKGCRAMEYKANFRPHELLHPDGQWRRT